MKCKHPKALRHVLSNYDEWCEGCGSLHSKPGKRWIWKPHQLLTKPEKKR